MVFYKTLHPHHHQVSVEELENHAGVDGFWKAMQQQSTLQRCTPLERWDFDALYDPEAAPGRAYTRFGAFAADVDLHDAAFFRLSRTEGPLP